MSTVIAELYEVFRVDKEGLSMTLLPTTMPVGILDMAFRFGKDTSDVTFNRNLEHMTGQAILGGLPTGSVGYPDTAYDYRSISRRSKRPRRKGM